MSMMQLIGACLLLPAVFTATAALAADAENGKRLAVLQCSTCHMVLPSSSNEVAQAPPFEAIARKFALTPEFLAFWILDPHPKMNLILARRDVEDIASYINTLAK